MEKPKLRFLNFKKNDEPQKPSFIYDPLKQEFVKQAPVIFKESWNIDLRSSLGQYEKPTFVLSPEETVDLRSLIFKIENEQLDGNEIATFITSIKETISEIKLLLAPKNEGHGPECNCGCYCGLPETNQPCGCSRGCEYWTCC